MLERVGGAVLDRVGPAGVPLTVLRETWVFERVGGAGGRAVEEVLYVFPELPVFVRVGGVR